MRGSGGDAKFCRWPFAAVTVMGSLIAEYPGLDDMIDVLRVNWDTSYPPFSDPPILGTLDESR